jgi:hypothetical protein
MGRHEYNAMVSRHDGYDKCRVLNAPPRLTQHRSLRHPFPLSHSIGIRPTPLHSPYPALRLLPALLPSPAYTTLIAHPPTPVPLISTHGHLARLVSPRGDLVRVCALLRLEGGGDDVLTAETLAVSNP